MRDPARIDQMLDELRTLWKQCPDLRLGQLIIICTRDNDPFYTEDDIMLERIICFSKTLQEQQ